MKKDAFTSLDFLIFAVACTSAILSGCKGAGESTPAPESIPLVSIQMVTIEVGDVPTFIMGDGVNGPNVAQNITNNYQMSKTEITNEVFAQFILDEGYSNSSYWTTNGWDWKQSSGSTQPGEWENPAFSGSTQPVVALNWYEAVAFCNWRSAKEGLTPAYNSFGQAIFAASGYRLPTEVEWEYAAAKGAPGQPERLYAWGDTWDPNKCVWAASKTADVGSKSPGGDTPQGLADMSGNALEWCSDNWEWSGGIVAATDRYHFFGDGTNNLPVQRGGWWSHDIPGVFVCSIRDGTFDYPSARSACYGFRVARR